MYFSVSMMYFIPQDVLRIFQDMSSKNCSADGRHVETLAYLFGYESDGFIGTHLIFPEQDGTCSKVDDKGNFYKLSHAYNTLER